MHSHNCIKEVYLPSCDNVHIEVGCISWLELWQCSLSVYYIYDIMLGSWTLHGSWQCLNDTLILFFRQLLWKPQKKNCQLPWSVYIVSYRLMADWIFHILYRLLYINAHPYYVVWCKYLTIELRVPISSLIGGRFQVSWKTKTLMLISEDILVILKQNWCLKWKNCSYHTLIRRHWLSNATKRLWHDASTK